MTNLRNLWFVFLIFFCSVYQGVAQGGFSAPHVAAHTPILSPVSWTLADARRDQEYGAHLEVKGGIPSYSWAVTAGKLPPGLQLVSTTGAITGVATEAGTYTFTVSVQDAARPHRQVSKAVTLRVVSPLVVSTKSLTTGVVGSTYAGMVHVAGGTPTYQWTVKSGSLPAGLTLSSSTGRITGTPKVSGTSNVELVVSDASSPAQFITALMSIVVPYPIRIETQGLPGGIANTQYSTKLSAEGGSAPYTWSVLSGTLPAGLSLNSKTGILSGTPTSGGSSTFRIKVEDSASPHQVSAIVLSVGVQVPLKLTTSAMPTAKTGSSFSTVLQASGGTPTYTWKLESGSLPAGLSLSAQMGTITGTPATAGSYSFVVGVSDASHPAQTVSSTVSLAVAVPLAIMAKTFPKATAGAAYVADLTATGGVPAYTWSMPSGSLPSGLTMSASSGVISGTPTSNGTSNFTVSVSDNGSPEQRQTVNTSITVASEPPPATAGTTWYIRPDGGTRYSASRLVNGTGLTPPSSTTAQCDGTHDAPFPPVGTVNVLGKVSNGVNQPCAYNDYRFLWDDQTYGNSAWVISGGDTVILRGGPWRVGFDQGLTSSDLWCRGGSGPFVCVNPTIPAGTPTQHTRILGENFATCHNGNVADTTQMTQIFGGYGAYTPLNIGGAQNLDVQCLEITRHSTCGFGGTSIKTGNPIYPLCSKTSPIDDFDSDGIEEDNKTANVNLTDLWIHGHPGRGIKGPIGGLVTATRVDIAFNEAAGWDFDDGSGTPFGEAAEWHFNYSTIEWSGCYQEYPMVHPIPALACFGQSTQGYGDGVGSAPGQGGDVYIDHSIFRYNVQDGEDFGHVDVGRHQFSVTNSLSYANGGAQFKWGWGFINILFENNIVMANCERMSKPIDGTPATYNANLGDFCRAGDALSFNFEDGSVGLFANNTIISYAGTTFDEQCVPITAQGQTNCNSTVFTLKNNILRAYSNPIFDYNGDGAPAAFCGNGCNNSTKPIGTINRDHNIFYGLRGTCTANTQTTGAASGTSTNEACIDPKFVNEPASFINETTLDNYAISLAQASPARGTGTPISDLTKDYYGVPYFTPPSKGALEYDSDVTVTTTTPMQ